MQTEISKTLKGIFARTAFDTAKAGIERSLKDYLMLEILRTEGSQACRIVASQVDRATLERMAERIKHEAPCAANCRRQRPEEFFAGYADELAAAHSDAGTITSAHLLFDILDDRTTITSRIFSDDQKALMRLERDRLYHAAAPLAPPLPPALDKFGTDLTRRAREGKIDRVVGRDTEIERVIRILSRRKKSNPVLTGEAGVGKSAIVEGVALRMAAGEVPANLRRKRIFALDIAALVAGTKFRGEFEERMQQLLGELRTTDDTILFIDEIHTITGAGSTQGGLDTADILKPALAGSDLQVIGATTLDEYRRCIESDAALGRRFQRVMVEPATREQTLGILRGIAPDYERHHNVRYTDEALQACVELSDRYITDRQLPDKAIDLLDEAGAAAQPAAQIGARAIAAATTSMTGIPVADVKGGGRERLRTLGKRLAARIVGQEEAVETVTKALQRARSGLGDRRRPMGVFLFAGPTGVGKTLLAKELAKELFGSGRGLIRLDMSEFAQPHNAARLTGAPPGYTGYGEGGQLTEAVRRHPCSVVLFDEVEKAHPDLFNMMLQIFDEGSLTDGAGRRVDFSHTVIVLTSNVGSRSAASRSAHPGYVTPSTETDRAMAEEDEYSRAIEAAFPPELLNRIDRTVIFRTLQPEDAERIVELELRNTTDRAAGLGLDVRVTAAAKRLLARKGYDSRYGVRALHRTIADQVEEPLAALIIEGKLRDGDRVVVEKSKLTGGVVLRVA